MNAIGMVVANEIRLNDCLGMGEPKPEAEIRIVGDVSDELIALRERGFEAIVIRVGTIIGLDYVVVTWTKVSIADEEPVAAVLKTIADDGVAIGTVDQNDA